MSADKIYCDLASEISAKLAKLDPDVQQEVIKRVKRILCVA